MSRLLVSSIISSHYFLQFNAIIIIFTLLFFSELSYNLHLRPTGLSDCYGLRDRREGVELAVRIGNSIWIPLQVQYYIFDSFAGTEVIRGHSVEVVGNASPSEAKRAVICGDLLRGNIGIQFRWMGSAYFDRTIGEEFAKHDVWALSNVTASLITDSGNTVLVEDMFGSDTLKYVYSN